VTSLLGNRTACAPVGWHPFRRRAGLTVAVAAALGVATTAGPTAGGVDSVETPASRVFQVVGLGIGTGHGLSQMGTWHAARAGQDVREMLSFYFPAASLTIGRDRPVRVLMGTTEDAVVVRGVRGTRLRAADEQATMQPVRRPVGCERRPSRWRVSTDGSALRLDARCAGRWVAAGTGTQRVVARVRRGLVQASVPGGRMALPGSVEITAQGGILVRVVSRLSSSAYVAAVLPQVVDPAWPAQALRAHAVVVRSATERAVEVTAQRVPDRGFDLSAAGRWTYAGVRQLGRRWAVVRERTHPATSAAASDTAGWTLRARGLPVSGLFSMSNGGVTARAADATPTPRVDRYDPTAYQNPKRAWALAVPAAAIAEAVPSIGDVRTLRVVGREGVGSWGGRVSALEVVGSAGSVTLGPRDIVAVLGLPSTYFDLRAGDVGGWAMPVVGDYRWGAEYGRTGPWWSLGYHTGQDFPAPTGSRVVSAAPGTVVSLTTTGAYGICVVLEHPDGMRTRYAHLNAAYVRAGMSVPRGQVIGAVGSTGNSTGPHLHFEIAVAGVVADPAPLLRGAPATAPSAAEIDERLASRPLLAYGSDGSRVPWVQRALGVSPTGYFGPVTQDRLRDLQRRRGLQVTGSTTVETWAALERLAAAGESLGPAVAERDRAEVRPHVPWTDVPAGSDWTAAHG
jgi:murein DD-endopeptidase MepM/ murein hydrolase activator NlpD